MRLAPFAIVLLTLAACGGRPAQPTPTTGTAPAPAPAQPEAAKPVSLEAAFAAAAPKGRPDVPRWDEVLPGMDIPAIAERIGAPDVIKSHGAEHEARWRTGPFARDPYFIVWISDGVATRMRFRDRL